MAERYRTYAGFRTTVQSFFKQLISRFVLHPGATTQMCANNDVADIELCNWFSSLYAPPRAMSVVRATLKKRRYMAATTTTPLVRAPLRDISDT